MKALFFLFLLLGGVWWWRSRQPTGDNKAPEVPPAQPLDMVRCTQCGMHIPSAEAVQGKQGPYCSHEHLKQLEP